MSQTWFLVLARNIFMKIILVCYYFLQCDYSSESHPTTFHAYYWLLFNTYPQTMDLNNRPTKEDINLRIKQIANNFHGCPWLDVL